MCDDRESKEPVPSISTNVCLPVSKADAASPGFGLLFKPVERVIAHNRSDRRIDLDAPMRLARGQRDLYVVPPTSEPPMYFERENK